MSDIQTIAAEARDRAGKGTSRAVRRTGRVPAVIYGNKQDPELISIDERGVLRELQRGGFLSKLFDIEVNGRKTRVLPRDVQLHPVSDRPIHVDFMRVAEDSRIRVMVPVVFANELDSPGLKRGGVLNVVRHQIEFYCAADSIPHHVTINLAGSEIGDSIHISAIELPKNVTPVISDRDFTVATVAPPTVIRDPDAKPAEAGAGGAAAPGAEAEKKAGA
jgi:large subunit ribosomal protein L25